MEFNNSGANILVIGVGGGGNNAVNRMIDSGIDSAEFIAANTDAQVLKLSKVKQENRLQLGEKLTKGKGAGGKPNVGEDAARESIEQIRDCLNNVDLLFITAGMGGGTGTGAAPVFAEEAKKLGILTIGIVTKPFNFEGPVRMENAMNGISKISKFVDTLIVIPNEKLLKMSSRSDSIMESFKIADNVLRIGIQGISDLIAHPSVINLDFADVKSIIENSGKAHMGLGEGEGENAMLIAVQQAVSSPLLETSISGAKGVIMNIVGGSPNLLELEKACNHIKNVADPRVNFIFGVGVDESLTGKIRVTIIATGFADKAKTVGATPAAQQGAQSGFGMGGNTVPQHAPTGNIRTMVNPLDEKTYAQPTSAEKPQGNFGFPTNGGFGGGQSSFGTSNQNGFSNQNQSGFGTQNQNQNNFHGNSQNGFQGGGQGGFSGANKGAYENVQNGYGGAPFSPLSGEDDIKPQPIIRKETPKMEEEPTKKPSFLDRFRKGKKN